MLFGVSSLSGPISSEGAHVCSKSTRAMLVLLAFSGGSLMKKMSGGKITTIQLKKKKKGNRQKENVRCCQAWADIGSFRNGQLVSNPGA